MGEGEKERRREHRVGKLRAEEEGRDRGSDHPDEKIEGEAKGAPGVLESVADEEQEPERDQQPERLSTSRADQSSAE